MSSASRVLLALPRRPAASAAAGIACRAGAAHALHLSRPNQASVSNIDPSHTTAKPGPPANSEPAPEPSEAAQRIARRKKQAELLRQAKGLKADGKTKTLKRRFWSAATVNEVDGGLQIHLDTRPLRHPTTKEIIRLPTTKPGLAHALAMEWATLTSAQDITKPHLVPLTSLICRAIDIAADDAAATTPMPPIRSEITKMLLRYLDTDSLLCWAPAPPDPNEDAPGYLSTLNDEGYCLRELQEETALRTMRYLTRRVWPGLTLGPVLEGTSVIPRKQAPGTRDVVRGWIWNLDAWELAALERATLAGKSLLAAARLIVEWSEGKAGVFMPPPAEDEGPFPPTKFGVEMAARAVSVEVDWQTANWGAVEDTHDVEHEDIRKQFGSAVLLVSGIDAKDALGKEGILDLLRPQADKAGKKGKTANAEEAKDAGKTSEI